MSDDRSSDETTIFAIYSTRRDAGMARDYLEDEGIETFVQADDAGGMHPQMQRPHGVKLVGMRADAQDAYEALNAADLLPEPMEEAPERRETQASSDDLTMSMGGTAGLLGLIAVLLIVLYYFFVA